VMMVVVGSSKTYVARLLNRPAEGSDVVCWCLDQSVSELWPFPMQKITQFLSPSMTLAVGVLLGFLPNQPLQFGLLFCINVDILFCCSFRSHWHSLSFYCVFCAISHGRNFISSAYMEVVNK
jgi:hypothetical protein